MPQMFLKFIYRWVCPFAAHRFSLFVILLRHFSLQTFTANLFVRMNSALIPLRNMPVNCFCCFRYLLSMPYCCSAFDAFRHSFEASFVAGMANLFVLIPKVDAGPFNVPFECNSANLDCFPSTPLDRKRLDFRFDASPLIIATQRTHRHSSSLLDGRIATHHRYSTELIRASFFGWRRPRCKRAIRMLIA